jgi:hypothetical protein
MRDIEARVVGALRGHRAVRNIRLVGSRAEGRANPRSDWDFRVETTDFPALAGDLPALLTPLEPLAQQWDRLSEHQCWMVTLRGPVKIDLIFSDEPHRPEPAWIPAADNLEAIDRHFWDWILWLSSKDAAGREALVQTELSKLFDHLLSPLGVARPPATLVEAIRAYRDALSAAEERFEVQVPSVLETEVSSALGV